MTAHIMIFLFIEILFFKSNILVKTDIWPRGFYSLWLFHMKFVNLAKTCFIFLYTANFFCYENVTFLRMTTFDHGKNYEPRSDCFYWSRMFEI